MQKFKLLIGILIYFIIGLIVPSAAYAMQPPTNQQVEQYTKDGSIDEKVQKAKLIGNQKTSPNLIWQSQQKAKSLVLKAQGISEDKINSQLIGNTPPLAWQGLPTKGSPKVLAILIDFSDYPHNEEMQSVDDFKLKFTGSGDPSLYPYDSLTNFYKRSSYDQLNITGDALGWYRAENPRSYYEGLEAQTGVLGAGQDALIKEAVLYYDTKGQDFSQYDNNNDGVIDTTYIKWTGPNNGWSNFWWAYQWNIHNRNYTVDGKTLNKYVWSWYGAATYYSDDWTGEYEPHVDIHETGHALGLPDYYDYNPDIGPDGGVGGLDMMDNNWGDHNCFSKFLLDWITPTVIESGTQTKIFNPSGTSPDAAIIMPNANSNVFNQYFMVQYRKRSTGNDPASYPTDGMLVWHVDATLNVQGTDYKYDNSYTTHKLLALEQADGLGEIENNYGANAGDFYKSSNSFTPNTTPNSNKYENDTTNVLTNVSLTNFTSASSTMGVDLSILPGLSFSASGHVTEAANSSLQTTMNAYASSIDERWRSSPILPTKLAPSTTMIPITIGQKLSGTLSITDTRLFDSDDWYHNDFYSFTLTHQTTIALELNSSQFSPWVQLYKQGNDGSYYLTHGERASGIQVKFPQTGSITLEPGKYAIGASQLQNNGFGNYTVNLLGYSQSIAWVTMKFTKVSGSGTAIPSAVQTDSNGNWSQTGFDNDTTYKVTPTKQGYSFAPIFLTITGTKTTGDFTGINKIALTTAVKNATTLLGSKTVGTAVGNVSQAAHNAYNTAIISATGVKNSSSVTQAQVDAAVTTLATATTTFNNSIVTPSKLQFSVATYSVGEAGPTATITVRRLNGSIGVVSVTYATSNGTATAGSDYTTKTGTLIFAAGEVSKTFTIPITNNTLGESNETVILKLSNPKGGATLGTPSQATLTILDNDKPSTPAGLTATVPSRTSILLKWGTVSGATSYNVYRATSATGTYTKVATVTSANYTNTGLTLGASYWYKVSAKIAVPGTPKGLTATVPSRTSIQIKWTAVNGVTSYNVYRATSATGTYTKIATVTSANYTNSGLTLGAKYWYKVSATNGVGTSALTSAVSAKT